MTSKRKQARTLRLTAGHVVSARPGGGWEHHASCPCEAGQRTITSRRTFRMLPSARGGDR